MISTPFQDFQSADVVFVGNVTSNAFDPNASLGSTTFNVSSVLKSSISTGVQSVSYFRAIRFCSQYFQVGVVYEVYASLESGQLSVGASGDSILINNPSDVYTPPQWLLYSEIVLRTIGAIAPFALPLPLVTIYLISRRRLKSAKGLTDQPRIFSKLKAAAMMSIGATLLVFGLLWIPLSYPIVNAFYGYNDAQVRAVGLQLLGLILASLGAGLLTYGHTTRNGSVQQQPATIGTP